MIFQLILTKKKKKKKKFHAKFAWFEEICVHSDCFCRSQKRFDPGVKSTSDNNANRDESTATSQLEHLKIVFSTCNVRPYDVSRAGWKFFPSPPLAGISFATYATGISRGEEWGRDRDRRSTSSFFFANSHEIPQATQSVEAEKNFRNWHPHRSFIACNKRRDEEYILRMLDGISYNSSLNFFFFLNWFIVIFFFRIERIQSFSKWYRAIIWN